MLIVEMTEDSKDMLLKEIESIQSDIWDVKTKTISELEDYIDKIDSRLQTFINDLESELMEYEE